MTEIEKVPSIPNKGGRPKGSKTRPKAIRAAEKLNRKPAPGRPKGSPNKPKTLEQFLTVGLLTQLPPKPAPRPKNPNLVRAGAANAFGKTPEERSANARKASLSRKVHTARAPGTPPLWSTREYAPLKEEARVEARRIYKIMDKQGLLPEDEIAKEALLAALTLMREPGAREFKLKVIRTLLDHTHQKPTLKQDVTVKTAEDWLDELANKTADDAD